MNVTTNRNGIINSILDVFPPLCAEFYTKHTPFVHKIIRLNLATENEILSIIWILHEERRLTLPELAKEIGVRKIDGVWCSVDPICGHATSLTQLEEQGFDVTDERGEHNEEPQLELPVGLITTTRELSDKLNISLRRAQQIYKAKLADLRGGYDLFGMEV
jgi:hypothetical protein